MGLLEGSLKVIEPLNGWVERSLKVIEPLNGMVGRVLKGHKAVGLSDWKGPERSQRHGMGWEGP